MPDLDFHNLGLPSGLRPLSIIDKRTSAGNTGINYNPDGSPFLWLPQDVYTGNAFFEARHRLSEETAFVGFLVDHKAEAGDGGNFKMPTFQRAAAHIAHLHKEGPVKTQDSAKNKWTSFRKFYRIIRAIQSVSGWVWDDEKSACIDADSASTWDDYVKKHPEAKAYRNKGWKHFSQVALIMPSTASSTHVFHPTAPAAPAAPNPAAVDASDHSASPKPDSLPKVASDSQEVEDSDDEDKLPLQVPSSRKRSSNSSTSHAAPKRLRASHNASALQSMSTSLADFGTAITAALAPPVPIINPSPIRRTTAVAAVLRQEANSLTLAQHVVLIDFLRTDRTAADIYLALTEPDVREEWVRLQLEKLDVALF